MLGVDAEGAVAADLCLLAISDVFAQSLFLTLLKPLTIFACL